MRPPTVARVTIVDVAQAAGVSVSTVSKVINDRYGVSPETYDKVMGVVEELGYESSLVASSLRRGSTNVIGILVPEFEPFSTELLKGISAAAEGTGYELLAYSGNLEHNQVGWERRSLSRLAGTLIDGAVIVAPTATVTDATGISGTDAVAWGSRHPSFRPAVPPASASVPGSGVSGLLDTVSVIVVPRGTRCPAAT